MGILGRAHSALSQNFDALLRRLEDPGRDIGELIEQMKEQVSGAQRELIALLGEAKVNDTRIAECEKEIAVWEKRAELAVSNGNDALAREALVHKRRVLDELRGLTRTRAERLGIATRAKSEIDEMKRRTLEIEQSRHILATRVSMARHGGGPAALGQMGDNSPLEALRQVESDIEHAEAMASANEELDALLGATRLGTMTSSELERQVAQLVETQSTLDPSDSAPRGPEDGILPVRAGETVQEGATAPAAGAGEDDFAPRVRIRID